MCLILYYVLTQLNYIYLTQFNYIPSLTSKRIFNMERRRVKFIQTVTTYCSAFLPLSTPRSLTLYHPGSGQKATNPKYSFSGCLVPPECQIMSHFSCSLCCPLDMWTPSVLLTAQIGPTWSSFTSSSSTLDAHMALKSLLNERPGARSQHSGGLRLSPRISIQKGILASLLWHLSRTPCPLAPSSVWCLKLQLICPALIGSLFSRGSQLFCLAVSSNYEPPVLAWQVYLVPALPNRPFHSSPPPRFLNRPLVLCLWTSCCSFYSDLCASYHTLSNWWKTPHPIWPVETQPFFKTH